MILLDLLEHELCQASSKAMYSKNFGQSRMRFPYAFFGQIEHWMTSFLLYVYH
jgi:hypothetical protein